MRYRYSAGRDDDDRGDGVALSFINGRAETRTRVKPVVAGQGEQELSPEEARAVQAAGIGTGLPATVPGLDRAPRHSPATA